LRDLGLDPDAEEAKVALKPKVAVIDQAKPPVVKPNVVKKIKSRA
jgi:hypothetical protein